MGEGSRGINTEGDAEEEDTDRVTATELVRNFGYWQDRAKRVPISITHHGKTRLILHSADVNDGDQGTGAADRISFGLYDPNQIRIAFDNLHENVAVFDNDWRFVAVNKAGETYFGQTEESLRGTKLLEALPQLDNSYSIGRLREANKQRASVEFETESTLVPGQMLAIRAFPYGGGMAVCTLDISERESYRKSEHERRSLLKSLAAHEGIGIASLNIRGRFDKASQSLTKLLELRDHSLEGMRFEELFPASEKAKARDFLEVVLNTSEEQAFDASVLQGGTKPLSVRIALSPKRSQIAVDGATMILTLAKE